MTLHLLRRRPIPKLNLNKKLLKRSQLRCSDQRSKVKLSLVRQLLLEAAKPQSQELKRYESLEFFRKLDNL